MSNPWIKWIKTRILSLGRGLAPNVASYQVWRREFMAQRLSLAIACASLYFLSFLPLDIFHYFQSGRHPLALLWVGVNIARLLSLLGCWSLLRWGSAHHVTATFLLTSLTLNGFQRGFDTVRGLTIPGLELDPDLFSWALIFITQATLVPMRWRLHLLTQIVTVLYVFGMNPLLGVDVIPTGMAPLNLYMNLFWIFSICNLSVYFYDRLAQNVFQTQRQLQKTNRQLGKTNRQLEAAQARSERLLLNILPSSIATQLKSDTSTIAENFAEVTVLFADIVGFTELTQKLSPIALVELLNQVFSAFDQLTDRYHLEKIKTIGDAYMVVAGLPEHRQDHASAIADMALEMQRAIARLNQQTPYQLAIRVGIHTGPVVAGVIGLKKFAYDLWGDTVNMASRLESHGIPGKIQVSPSTYDCLKDRYELQRRGTVDLKGKGPVETYWLLGHRDPNGRSVTQAFAGKPTPLGGSAVEPSQTASMTIPGLKELSRKSNGTRTIIQFTAEGDAATTLLALIEKLPVGAELTAVEMTWTECYLDVRVTKSGLEKKRASHGSHGTWQSCSAAEAAEWLRPRLEAVMADPSTTPCKLIFKGELPAEFA